MSIEQRTEGARHTSDFSYLGNDVLAQIRDAASALAEPALAYRHDDPAFLEALGNSLAGPMLAVDNSDRITEQEREEAINALLASLGLTRNDPEVQDAIRDIRSCNSRGELPAAIGAATAALQIIRSGVSLNLQEEADSAREEFERHMRNLNRMADELFGEDTPERREFDRDVNTAISSPNATEAAEAEDRAVARAGAAARRRGDTEEEAQAVEETVRMDIRESRIASKQVEDNQAMLFDVLENDPERAVSEPEVDMAIAAARSQGVAEEEAQEVAAEVRMEIQTVRDAAPQTPALEYQEVAEAPEGPAPIAVAATTTDAGIGRA